MIKRLALLLLGVMIFSAAGCKTLGQKGEYPNGYDPIERIEHQLKSGNYGEAESIWHKNQSYLKANADSAAEVKSLLITAAISYYNSTITACSTTLASIKWPDTESNWPATAQKMQKVASFVERAGASTILPQTVLEAAYKNLKNNYFELKQRMKTDAVSSFRAYNLSGAKDFFSVYPVSLNAKSFLSSQSAYLAEFIKKSDSSSLVYINKLYGKYLTPEFSEELAKCYYLKVLRNASPRRNPPLKAVLAACFKTRKSGFKLTQVPDLKIAFVRVTSQTLLKEHQLDFGLDIDVDLPLKTSKIKDGTVYNAKTAPDADIVVLINEEMSKIDRRSSSYAKRQSTYLSGYDHEDNPKYHNLEMRYKELQDSMDETRSTVQMNSMLGLGGAIANIGVLSDLDAMKDESVKIRKKLSSTPQKIRSPKFDTYSYSLVTIDDTKLSTINYYVIDRRKHTFFTGNFDIKQSQSFKVPYGVMASDPEKENILRGQATEKNIDEFEHEPVKVKISNILSAYINSNYKLRKYRSTAEIRKTILNDRNKAVAEYKKTIFKADTSNDPRFDSVVVIICPAGVLGAGFYVTSDVILTNFHVVKDSKFVELLLHNGIESFGKVEAFDAERDLALLKIQARGKPVTFYGRQSLPLGATLEAIGHPQGLKYTITRGVFSAMRSMKGDGVVGKNRAIRYIQTDASINPGNSGGPLFYGNKVVGVNSLASKSMETTNFAIHYAEVLDFLNQYKIDYRKGTK